MKELTVEFDDRLCIYHKYEDEKRALRVEGIRAKNG